MDLLNKNIMAKETVLTVYIFNIHIKFILIYILLITIHTNNNYTHLN